MYGNMTIQFDREAFYVCHSDPMAREMGFCILSTSFVDVVALLGNIGIMHRKVRVKCINGFTPVRIGLPPLLSGSVWGHHVLFKCFGWKSSTNRLFSTLGVESDARIRVLTIG